MPGGLIAQAFVEIAADSKKFEADLDHQVNAPIKDVETTAKNTADSVSGAFKRSADDLQREFGMSAHAADQALQILNGETFSELRQAAARAGEAVDRSMSENAQQAGHELETVDSHSFSELRHESDRTGTAIARDFQQAADKADRSFDGIHASARTHFAGIGLAATGAAAVIGGLGVIAVKQGLETAGGLEQSQTAFEGVLGSADAARTEMAKLTDFAARTPLELPGLLEMDSRLIAVHDALGLSQDQILPFIGTVGDLASTLGQGQPQMDAVVVALSQMGSAGRVSAQDVGQISNALPGFNAWKAIADGMGLTVAEVRDLGEKGQLTADQAIPALIKGMKEFPGAAGAMERSSQTLNGMLSTFKDTANIALAQGLAPLVEGIKTQLPAITAGLAPLFTSIGVSASTIFATIGPSLAGALGPIGSIVAQLGNALTPFLTVITTLGAALGPGLAAGAEAIGNALASLSEPLANLAGPIGDAVGRLFQALAPVIPVLATAFGNLADALLPIVTPLADFIATLGEALAPVLTEVAQVLSDMVVQFSLGLGPAIQDIFNALKPLLPLFVELVRNALLPLGPELPDIARSMGELAKAVSELVVAILPLIEPFLKLQILIQQLTGAALQQVAKLLIVVADAVARLLSWVAQVIPPLDQFKDWFRTFGAQVVGVWDTTWAAVSDAVTTAVDAVVGAGQSVVGFFQSVWAGIDEFIIGPVRTAFDFIRPVFEGFVTFVKVDLQVVAGLIVAPFVAAFLVLRPVVEVGWAAIQAIFDAAVTFFSATWALLNTYIVTPITTALDTLGTGVGIAWALVQTVFQTALDWFTATWALINTYIVQPIQAGLDAAFSAATTVWATVQGVFQTGLDWVSSTWASISGLLSGPVDAGINAASTAVSTVWSTAQGILQTGLDWVRDTWNTVEDKLKAPVTGAMDAIKTAVGDMWDHVKGILNSVISGVNTLINGWNSLEFTLPSIDIPGVDLGPFGSWGGATIGGNTFSVPNIPNIPGLATGGLVKAEGLAFLHPAEVVVPAPAAAAGMGGVNFNGPVTFGADMATAMPELDWWARYKMRSVP